MPPPANKRDSPSMLSRLNTSTDSRPASSRNRTSTCTRRGLLPLWQRTGEIPSGSTLIRGAGFLLAVARNLFSPNSCQTIFHLKTVPLSHTLPKIQIFFLLPILPTLSLSSILFPQLFLHDSPISPRLYNLHKPYIRFSGYPLYPH